MSEPTKFVKKDCGIHWGLEAGPCKKCALNAKYQASGGLQYGGTPWAAVLGDKAPQDAPQPERKSMKMKKSQLKEAVKAVVRQCLNERLMKEGCGSKSNKRFTGKAGRMFKHVEDSEKEQGKSTKVAKRIAGATVNKRLKTEQVGADVVAGENIDDDAAQTPIEKVVEFVLRKVPEIKNPEKVARIVMALFQHQYKNQQPPDQETLLGLVQKHMNGGMAQPQNEMGLTSETGEEDHAYDEKEEIMLIKVMALIAKKLEAMHAGMSSEDPQGVAVDMRGETEISEPSEEPSAATVGGEEEPSEEPSPFGPDSDLPLEPEEPEEPEEPSAPPFGGGEEEPSEEPAEKPEKKKEPKEPKKDDKKGKKKEFPLKEVSAKTQTQTYRVAPNPSVLTQKTDDEKLKPKDPRLTELNMKMRMGPSHKTIQPVMYQDAEDDVARRTQFDPKMTEAKKKKMKENHRVQTRSYVTVKDNPNDPNKMRDPENPQSNGA